MEKLNKSRNWVYSEETFKSNQVRIHLEGTYTVAGRLYTPRVHYSTRVVTLKELDHTHKYLLYIPMACIWENICLRKHCHNSKMVVNIHHS